MSGVTYDEIKEVFANLPPSYRVFKCLDFQATLSWWLQLKPKPAGEVLPPEDMADETCKTIIAEYEAWRTKL